MYLSKNYSFPPLKLNKIRGISIVIYGILCIFFQICGICCNYITIIRVSFWLVFPLYSRFNFSPFIPYIKAAKLEQMFGLFDFFVCCGAGAAGRKSRPRPRNPDPEPENPNNFSGYLLQLKKKPSIESLKVCHYAGKYNYKCD